MLLLLQGFAPQYIQLYISILQFALVTSRTYTIIASLHLLLSEGF